MRRLDLKSVIIINIGITSGLSLVSLFFPIVRFEGYAVSGMVSMISSKLSYFGTSVEFKALDATSFLSVLVLGNIILTFVFLTLYWIRNLDKYLILALLANLLMFSILMSLIRLTVDDILPVLLPQLKVSGSGGVLYFNEPVITYTFMYTLLSKFRFIYWIFFLSLMILFGYLLGDYYRIWGEQNG
ncbi:hypothetical protein A3L04_06865 [Thermococcus chitonophagus]|uniref:Uncharacterized protein n=1 Tax=Thermococcus chitonophagus TaxID=54262 RepID=A0A2Z2NGH7_9EURY|nr:hypothetical protein [Thermococcus chitonophagus]ASJ16816.1 hypothetical protein A3L04_06865 [Thermococcus chitonophagus]